MKFLKKLFLFILLLITIVTIVFGAIGYHMYSKALDKEPLATKIQKVQQDENYVTLQNLPKDYLNAVIAVEDRRFYQHGAIDIISIGRAFYTNIKEKELVEGGSTLTQQLSKNLFFIQENPFIRKIAEIFMAHSIEENYEKDEILELYVNTCYFGDGYYTIREASLGYLGKEPSEMNLDESSLLAGIPNAPSAYAPTKNPHLARSRQRHVLKAMVKNNYISQEEANKIMEQYKNE